MKIALLFLFFAGTLTLNTTAQIIARDSAGIIRKARRDAVRFKLKTNDLKKFILEHWPASSDYFKPVASRGVDRSLLKDSVYVAAYRNAAFISAAHERSLLIRHESILKKSDTIPADSNKLNKEHLARDDVKNFNFSKDMLKRSKEERFKITSDYFSPTIQTTANVDLLKDSVYVKSFREEAYYKAFNTRVHPVGHVLLLSGIGAAAFTVLTIMVLFIDRHARG